MKLFRQSIVIVGVAYIRRYLIIHINQLICCDACKSLLYWFVFHEDGFLKSMCISDEG